MIIDTADLAAARAALREADEEVARALEKQAQARKHFEEVVNRLRAAAATINLLLDDKTGSPPDVVPIPPPPPMTGPTRFAPPPPPGSKRKEEEEETSRRTPRQIPPPPPAAPGSARLRPSVWEVVHTIPLDGSARLEDLRDALNLSGPALNMRVMRAKKLRLVETAGWGSYQLTEEGRALRGRHLQVVADEE